MSKNRVLQFGKSNGCNLVWGLNGLWGRTQEPSNHHWDPSNARGLLGWFRESQAPLLGVELGNELLGRRGILGQLSAEDAVEMVVQTRKIIDAIWSVEQSSGSFRQRPLVIGMDSQFDEDSVLDLLSALKRRQQHLDVFTVHYYSLGSGLSPGVRDIAIDPRHSLTEVDPFFKRVTHTLIEKGGLDISKTKMWLGESGGAYASGRVGFSGSVLNGFWYLENLAISLSYGFSHFCRQTLIGGNYGLLDTSQHRATSSRLLHTKILWNKLVFPRFPDFKNEELLTLLRRLVVPSGLLGLRIHTLCSRRISRALLLLILNYSPYKKKYVKFNVDALGRNRREYLLSSTDLDAVDVLLNGISLPRNAKDLSAIYHWVESMASNDIQSEIEPLSYAFIEFPHSHRLNGICSDEERIDITGDLAAYTQ